MPTFSNISSTEESSGSLIHGNIWESSRRIPFQTKLRPRSRQTKIYQLKLCFLSFLKYSQKTFFTKPYFKLVLERACFQLDMSIKNLVPSKNTASFYNWF